ncbi:MAG: LruC domain-containing protein [Candidatus Cloacimonetes bacterium]|nr:LruC domain-containing protein [Candidatus Cloacimonadota bacterium]
MKRTYILIMIVSVFALLLTACAEKEDDAFVPVKDLTISPDFDWQASRLINVDLQVLTNRSEPVSHVVFELFDAAPSALSSPIAKGATDEIGKFETKLNLPSRVASIWARGYMSTIEIPIVNNQVSYTFGGSVAEEKGVYKAPDSKDWSFIPGISYNSQGLPSPRTNVPLEAEFLSRVNASLPEYIALDVSHPEYLQSDNQQNLKIDQAAQVWITFVHEGANYKNSLGFHTYPNGNAPQTTSEIGTRTLILPNASLQGDGGQLNPGDTVYLGQFEGGTTLGWFLVSNGFTPGGSGTNVSTTAQVYYSTPELNPEGNPADKQHSVMVFDSQFQRFLIGFEDLNRTSGSDDDFNDLVFFITVNPIEAVDFTGIYPIAGSPDTDSDGIIDYYDDYPTDPELAFNNYTYGSDAWGTLAFEDLWPNVGDYDFNDMVVEYNYNQITQAANRVKKVEMRFRLKAIGARKANGFAIEVPFASSNIYAINASHPGLFAMEEGSEAVMRMFNSAFDLIPQQEHFINTEIGMPYYAPVEFSLSFKLQNPINIVNVEAPPYNPFIMANRVRSHEIHLPGFTPTALMDDDLFNTGDDSSAGGNWFKTAENLPWAVNIPASWDYPVENAQITRAHLKFKNWAQSSGSSYTDWYMNKPGYRDSDYIYLTP